MYLGYWLVIAGVLLIYRTWTPLLLLMVCVPAFYRRARREDETLAQTFGADWQSYAARTKSLIPFVY
jgi:protein-S-isoprenylcysteine O-methyltransferase Ste14